MMPDGTMILKHTQCRPSVWQQCHAEAQAAALILEAVAALLPLLMPCRTCGEQHYNTDVLQFPAQAPVILSQGDLQEKVAEVLDAVEKEQSAADSSQALPQIVLVRPHPLIPCTGTRHVNSIGKRFGIRSECCRALLTV